LEKEIIPAFKLSEIQRMCNVAANERGKARPEKTWPVMSSALQLAISKWQLAQLTNGN
jgi:hypothetical protein